MPSSTHLGPGPLSTLSSKSITIIGLIYDELALNLYSFGSNVTQSRQKTEGTVDILKGLCCDVPSDFFIHLNLIFHAPGALSITGLADDVLHYNDGLLEFRDVGQEGLGDFLKGGIYAVK